MGIVSVVGWEMMGWDGMGWGRAGERGRKTGEGREGGREGGRQGDREIGREGDKEGEGKREEEEGRAGNRKERLVGSGDDDIGIGEGEWAFFGTNEKDSLHGARYRSREQWAARG